MKVCATPGCPTLIASGSFCHECRRAQDRKRPSAAQRGYGPSTGWPSIRDRYIRAHPVCEAPECRAPSTDVDHVDGSGPYGNNSDANLEALCHSHHSSKTATQNGGFGR